MMSASLAEARCQPWRVPVTEHAVGQNSRALVGWWQGQHIQRHGADGGQGKEHRTGRA